MKVVILICVFIVCFSCSFKKNDESVNSDEVKSEVNIEALKSIDSDGDFINDFEEKNLGLDRFVANFPRLKTSFMQDYNISIVFDDESTMEMDTKVGRNNPNFKYRIGDIFLRENSLKNAASIGRFDGFSWGNIKQEDYSWVKYPDIDKDFYHSKVREFNNINMPIKDITITLENSLKLLENPLYRSVEKIEVSFYYYSHKKEHYYKIHKEILDQTFQMGTNEQFQIIISDPPQDLIEDNYFRKGEFIIAEIEDFYIPDLKMTYKTLMASIKNKSMAVYRLTPLETNIDYVAVEDNDSFVDIMAKLYAGKFEIQNDRLVRIEQFHNNLKNYTYLSELAESDKEGSWFIMTNKLKDHYLKHEFQPSDSITLSYITGTELSKNPMESVFSYQPLIESKDSNKEYILGNITSNSKVSISLFPVMQTGVLLNEKHEIFRFAPPHCKNCTGTNWSVIAEFRKNTFIPYEQGLNIPTINSLMDSVDILINNSVLDLTTLIKEDNLKFSFKGNPLDQDISIELLNLSKYVTLKVDSANILKLRLKAKNIKMAGEGLQMDNVTGHNINPVEHAPHIAMEQAHLAKMPIAITSWKFNEYHNRLPWGTSAPDGYVLTKGLERKAYDGIVLDVVSTITNYLN